MVIVHNPNPPPDPSDPGTSGALRGYNSDITIADFNFSFDHFKMTVCSSTMDYCATTIREDRACAIPGRCNGIYKSLIVPSHQTFCSFANYICDDDELDEKLKKLYAAEAITDNPDYSRRIDEKIKELNDLKHKAKIVGASLDIAKSRRARARYLEQKKKYDESESSYKSHAEKDIEEEEVYV